MLYGNRVCPSQAKNCGKHCQAGRKGFKTILHRRVCVLIWVVLQALLCVSNSNKQMCEQVVYVPCCRLKAWKAQEGLKQRSKKKKPTLGQTGGAIW